MLAIFACIKDTPDTATMPITPRVSKGHFIMPDHFVIKIKDVKRTIRPHLDIHWPEPQIFAGHEIRKFNSTRGRTFSINTIVVDSACNYIADDHGFLMFFREGIRVESSDAANTGAAMRVLDHIGAKA